MPHFREKSNGDGRRPSPFSASAQRTGCALCALFYRAAVAATLDFAPAGRAFFFPKEKRSQPPILFSREKRTGRWSGPRENAPGASMLTVLHEARMSPWTPISWVRAVRSPSQNPRPRRRGLRGNMVPPSNRARPAVRCRTAFPQKCRDFGGADRPPHGVWVPRPAPCAESFVPTRGGPLRPAPCAECTALGSAFSRSAPFGRKEKCGRAPCAETICGPGPQIAPGPAFARMKRRSFPVLSPLRRG